MSTSRLEAFSDGMLAIIASEGEGSRLKAAVGGDSKGKVSILVYVAAVVAATRWVVVALALYILVALMWLVPDRRFERVASEA